MTWELFQVGVFTVVLYMIIYIIYIYIVVGGVAEIAYCTPEKEILYLKKHRGFIKLAIQEGMHILPAFHHNNSLVLQRLIDRWGIMKRLMRGAGAALVPIFGSYGLPLPRRLPITMVIGEPVLTKQNPNPSQEEIDAVHDAYVKKITQLFEDFSDGKRELKIL